MITTKVAIENYLLTTIDSSFDTQVNEWIDAAYKFMCKATDRQLIADTADTEYLYDGNGKLELMIDDFISVTKVEYKYATDGTWNDITAYSYLYPSNTTPKWRLKSTYTLPANIPQNVRITGKKGLAADGSVPSDLKWAATVFVAGIINYSLNSEGEVKSESIGRYTVSYVTTSQEADFDRAMAIIKSYRRVR